MKIINGFETANKVLNRRTPVNEYPVSDGLRQGLKRMFGVSQPEQAVRLIIKQVKEQGDTALVELTERIDGIKLSSIEVGQQEIKNAYDEVDDELVAALKLAAQRVQDFHQVQKDNILHEMDGPNLKQLIRPLERVGVYVPGGTAAYPSTVLMTAIPARVAGVKEIMLVTPPKSDGEVPAVTLVAADIAGVDRVFRVGGAQAVAALAYGTKTVPKVDKICGPGNIFVMLAKKEVYGAVDIDGLQGPSEVMVIADDTSNPAFCAADLLAQAEHDTLAVSVMITTSQQMADDILAELDKQLAALSRREIIEASLSRGIMVIVANLDEALELANLYAPEHLCLLMQDAIAYIDKVKNAGCVVAGDKATVALGDYAAGPSHALPTGGTARFGSPLNVSDFLKYINVIAVDDGLLETLGKAAGVIARAEGLDAHARAVEKRLESD
ncbi:histidinol dehydrogenase [Chloroflexota bacterium]